LAGLLPAAVALLAFWTLAVSDDIDPITIGTVAHQGYHDSLIKVGGVGLQPRISDPQLYNIFEDFNLVGQELTQVTPEQFGFFEEMVVFQTWICRLKA
jgi:hypothetical protein